MNKFTSAFVSSFWIRAVVAAIVSGIVAGNMMPETLPIIVGMCSAPACAYICRSEPKGNRFKLAYGLATMFLLLAILDFIQAHLGLALFFGFAGSLFAAMMRDVIVTENKYKDGLE